MGGNALSACTPVRLTKENFSRLENQCLTRIREAFPAVRVEGVRAYREKADFGDLDLLISMSDYNPFAVADCLGTVETVRNGPVTSIGVKVREEVPFLDGNVFQVDLIKVDSEDFDTSVSYFAWNDLGNFMGRIAHKLGFKYGHDGLSMVLRDGDYQHASFSVSKDVEKIVEFLGYDFKRFSAGFDTLEEVFEFASSSPYFNKDIFLFENRNNVSRTRDKKRKSYNGFLTWMADRTDLPAYPWADMKEQGGPKYREEFVQKAKETFTGFAEAYDKAMLEFETWRAVKDNFNGDLVAEWTGLAGKELGEFMKHLRSLREVMGNEAWQSMVLCAGQPGMKKWVMPYLKAFQKEHSK